MAIHSEPVGSREEEAFRLVLEKLRRNKGVDFSLYRVGTLQRRIQGRLRTTGCADYAAYIGYLNQEPGEYDRLLEAITINVTEFFRDPETFEVLKERVIPEILKIKAAQGRRLVRVWSAGTSNGEEAYSLAVCFLEALKGCQVSDLAPLRSDFQITVHGTDIDPQCVRVAQKGLYPVAGFRKVARSVQERYFQPSLEDEGSLAAKEEVRALTRFSRHDLVCDPPLTHMDLILCRNVVIYFTRPLQEMVYANFAKALNEGGVLVLGKVESLSGVMATHFETVDVRERIYRKRRISR